MGITELIVLGLLLGAALLVPEESDVNDEKKQSTLIDLTHLGQFVNQGTCNDCGGTYGLGGGWAVHVKTCPVRQPKDRISQMWDQQVAFMKLLQEKRNFPAFPTDISSKQGQKFLKDIRNHIMEELFEAGQHLKNAKTHRATEIPEVDREAYKEELVDVLHLFFELAIASGISLEELIEAYLSKGSVNTQRILNGY